MATSQWGVNSPEAVKLWSRKLHRDAIRATLLAKFIGTDSSAMIQHKTEMTKGPGDRIRCILRATLSGDGVSGDNTLEGNEEALATHTDNVTLDQLRHAVRSDGKMTEQRVPFSVREEARLGLTDWWAERIDTALINHLTGNTGQTDTRYTGSNATTAPTTNRIVYAGGHASEASVESGSASNTFKLTHIDAAKEKAEVEGRSPIRPLMINGEKKFICVLHPYQWTQLKTNTATGQWLDITKAIYQGAGSKSPIYTGAMGEYNGVILHVNNRIPSVTSGVYRAVLCGAQAAVIAHGQGGSPNKMSWNEDMFDYGNQLGVEAGMIWGVKKTVFNSEDFGTVVIATHANASTA